MITLTMAQNKADTEIVCPRCGKRYQMNVDLDSKIATNVSVLECPDEDCEHRFAKDQSVKLSGSLVLEAVDAMEILGGYSSLGEFIRECVRMRVAVVQQQNNALAFGSFLTMISQDPDTWTRILSDDNEEE